jgi:hypothetical protein
METCAQSDTRNPTTVKTQDTALCCRGWQSRSAWQSDDQSSATPCKSASPDPLEFGKRDPTQSGQARTQPEFDPIRRFTKVRLCFKERRLIFLLLAPAVNENRISVSEKRSYPHCAPENGCHVCDPFALVQARQPAPVFSGTRHAFREPHFRLASVGTNPFKRIKRIAN